MFTGIIEAIGTVNSIIRNGVDAKLNIAVNQLNMNDVSLGDSISVNGVCLTVIKFSHEHFVADVSKETINKTAFIDLHSGSKVNLEKALTPSTRLGGHLVSGHVDGIGTITKKTHSGNSIIYAIKAPKELAKYIAKKGSITVDGVSLTVNEVNGREFYLNIVPHTLKQTIMQSYFKDKKVNLEVDLLARYLERLLLGEKAAKTSPITEDFLQSNGFK